MATATVKRKWLRWWVVVPAVVVVLVVVRITTADDPRSREVSRAEFTQAGLTWPLTPDAGTLECPGSGWVVFRPQGQGAEYAVNGLAKGSGRYYELDSIWTDDPTVAGLKVDASDLTDAGLNLCQ